MRQVRSLTQAQLLSLWDGLPNYGDTGKSEWLSVAPEMVATGQELIAELTDIYIAQTLSSMTGVDVPETGSVPPSFRQADPQEVYARMFKTVYYELSQDKSLEEAVQQGRTRANVTSGTDLWLAHTVTSREVLGIHSQREGLHIQGYRRVPSGVHTCALCSIAATQRYHKADLMPIHERCQCGVMPIIAESDPGQRIRAEYSKTIHDEDIPRDELATVDHSEIGPMLVFAGDHYRTATEAKSLLNS